MNRLKAALRSRSFTQGSWITFPAEAPTEIMARAGFEWLVIDMEHSPIDIEAAARLIRVIDLAGLPALCRLPTNDPILAKRVLDAGAAGIVVPCIESVEDAMRAVEGAFYPPVGKRGVGLARAQDYGGSLEEYRRRVGDDIVVICMIETRAGMEASPQIAKLPGVDGLFIGPYDLSASMGHIGQLDHPDVRAAEARIRDAARQAGIACGLHVVHHTPALVQRARDDGYTFLALGVDMIFLREAARAAARANHPAQGATR
jgi:2-dehydro-3-deoxyglucarate aldolase